MKGERWHTLAVKRVWDGVWARAQAELNKQSMLLRVAGKVSWPGAETATAEVGSAAQAGGPGAPGRAGAQYKSLLQHRPRQHPSQSPGRSQPASKGVPEVFVSGS